MFNKRTVRNYGISLFENRAVFIGIAIIVGVCVLGFWLLFTTFRRQQAVVHRSSCVDNLRGIGIALNQYALDNDEFYPSTAVWNDAPLTLPGIRGCPAAAPLARLPRLKADGVPGYAFNRILGERKRAEVVYPATTVIVCEQAAGIALTRAVDPYAGFPLYPKGMEKGWLRHDGGANYLFCDGHVKWFAPEAVHSDTANDVLDLNDGKSPTFVLQSMPLSRIRR